MNASNFDDSLLKVRSSGGGAPQDRRFAILRVAKIKTMANMAASLQHTFRERHTPNADPNLIRSNTVLHGPKTSGDVLKAWGDRAPEKIRANAVRGMEYFVGGSPAALNAMSRREQDAYFRQALDWIKQRHGPENVLSAVIHRDETTPHMSVMTIPLDGKGNLNARELVGNREKLRAMQTDFADRVGLRHGLERGIEGSQATHERVQSAYGRLQRFEERLNSVDAPVRLPERRTGAIFGFGGETEAEWRERASRAATDALTGAWSAIFKERSDHEVEIGSLRAELKRERQAPKRAEALQRDVLDLRKENSDLSKQIASLNAALQEAQKALRDLDAEVETTLADLQGVVDMSIRWIAREGGDVHEFRDTVAKFLRIENDAPQASEVTHTRARDVGDDWGI